MKTIQRQQAVSFFTPHFLPALFYSVLMCGSASADQPMEISGNIQSSGDLPKLQQAAIAVVDAMVPEQRMAVMVFADTSQVLAPMTSDKAALRADWFCLRTANATPICTTPHTSVNICETRKRCLSSACGLKGLYKSLTAVAAIALSDDDKAAAKIAATTKPDKPEGKCWVMKSGKTQIIH